MATDARKYVCAHSSAYACGVRLHRTPTLLYQIGTHVRTYKIPLLVDIIMYFKGPNAEPHARVRNTNPH